MLKRVSIQNFKSLKDVTLDLQKVNLLIGPNNSGKTNFLKALESLRFQGAKDQAEEFDRLMFHGAKGIRFFRIGLKYLVEGNKKIYDFYTIEISDKQGEEFTEFRGSTNKDVDEAKIWDISTLDEDFESFELNVNDDSFNAYHRYEKYVAENPSFISDTNFFKLSKRENTLKGEEPVPRGEIFDSFIKNLSFRKSFTKDSYYPLDGLKIYKPDPNKILLPGPVGTGEESVNADTSNLVGFLDLMLGKYRKSVFNKIEADLSTCIPEFDEVNLDDINASNELKKQFGDKSFKRLGLTNSKQGITYWADELSEGTLYFLALLCIINQPNPPKLLLLEEPEKGIHPRRIWEVMKLIFQLAEDKDIQIILTTHNEHVVNAFSTMPESVFVFDKDEEGATYVRNLQKDIVEPTDRKSEELGLDKIDLTSNLGENWLYGLIGGVPADEL